MTNRITYTTTVMRFVQPKNGALANRVTDIWDYGTRIRQLDKSASGQPLNDSWVQTGHGRPTLIWVDYQKRSWERFAIAPDVPASRPPLCQAPESLVIALTSGLTPALSNWQSMIGAGLRCGLFHVAGHQRVEGINAIKLTGRLAGSSRTGITLWVDPHTYLPVQMAGNVQTPTGKQNGPKATIKLKQEGTIWIYFRWLPPTQANLAQLTGTIPRGFHRTKPL
jgi:hypothetical protein